MVAHLDLIPYSFFYWIFLNTRPSNSFLWSYVIIVGLGYLHKHAYYTRLAMVAACLSLYLNISKHLVAEYIIVRYLIMRASFWYSLLTIYELKMSTNNLSYGMASDSFAVKWPYFKPQFLFFWQILQTLMWLGISSLELYHN